MDKEIPQKSFSETMTEFQTNLQAVKQAMRNAGIDIDAPWQAQIGILQKALIPLTTAFAKIPTVQIAKRYQCHEIFEKANYIFFERLTNIEAEKILNSKDIDTTLLEIHEQNNYKRLNKVIKKCISHKLITPNKELFKQSISAYEQSHYFLSAIGLFATADGLLTKTTGNLIHKFGERIKNIESYIKNEEKKNVYNVTEIYYLYETYISAANSIFIKHIDFTTASKAEYELLSRNTYIHGRTTRKTSQIDCIKLIYFIFATLELHDLYK